MRGYKNERGCGPAIYTERGRGGEKEREEERKGRVRKRGVAVMMIT